MFWSYLIGWAVAFLFAIVLLFYMGDPQIAMSTPAGWVMYDEP